MNKIKLFVSLLILSTLFSGCIRMDYDNDDHYSCKDPKYLSYTDLRENYPAIKEPREIQKAGKIYVYGDTLLINEKNIGIHVVDNSNKQNPKRVKFIEIPGNIDLAVKDGYLYVDSFIDLVVLNITDINNITKVHRQEKVFPYNHLQALSDEDMDKFKCYPDESRGVVVGYK